MQHDDLVGERHGLGLVVGDIDRRGAEPLPSGARARSASPRAAPHRGWRAARRTGRCCGSRTMARPMATRWRWPPESWRGLRSSRWSMRSDRRRRLDARLDLLAVGWPARRSA